MVTRLCVVQLMINKSDFRFTLILCCKLVWLQAELDSTRSYYHYESKL